MTESTKIDYVSIVQDLRDEADLCRNETATDIADLLDDAASCIVAMKSQFVALRADLAAAQEARQAAEARAEQNEKDVERIRAAFFEFYQDWKKGDFDLPKLAQYDVEAIAEAFAAIAGEPK